MSFLYDWTDDDWEVLPCSGNNLSSDTTISKFTGSPNTRSAKRNHTASVCNVKTLEDSFRYFNFDPSLDMLEKNLEDVRRRKKTVEDHISLIKRLEKSIIQRSKEHHPDKIQSRGGTEKELYDAQTLQTALNSTKKVMNILSKLFLEDLDIDHKYGFYTNLDISHLGNEDEIESHVYEVLFKISLISEIKQRHIISEIRNFLMESQSCIESYISDSLQDFEKYLSSAIFRLKQCIGGYNKLLRELEEVEEECIVDEQNNSYSLIRKMRMRYSKQLNHLTKLSEVVDSCMEGKFQIFTCSEEFDDYFVYPFVCYINLILMCRVFVRIPSKSKFKIFDQKKLLPVPIYNEQTLFLTSLYYLTSYYFGSKNYLFFVQKLLNQKDFHKQSVKEKFLDILLEKNEYLMNKFKIDEYNENGSKRYILEELKKCQEMKSEFEEKKRELVEDITLIKKSNEEMNQQVDKIISDRAERQKEYEACLAGNFELQEKFALRKKSAPGMMDQPLDTVMNDNEECCKEFEACSAIQFELSKNIPEEMNQEMSKIIREREEGHKKYESSLAKNSNLQEQYTRGKINFENMNQQSQKIMSDKECQKVYEACSAEYFEIGKNITEKMKEQVDRIMKVGEQCHKDNESNLARNSELQEKSVLGKKDSENIKQQLDNIRSDREELRKKYEECLASNSEIMASCQQYLRKNCENN